MCINTDPSTSHLHIHILCIWTLPCLSHFLFLILVCRTTPPTSTASNMTLATTPATDADTSMRSESAGQYVVRHSMQWERKLQRLTTGEHIVNECIT